MGCGPNSKDVGMYCWINEIKLLISRSSCFNFVYPIYEHHILSILYQKNAGSKLHGTFNNY